MGVCAHSGGGRVVLPHSPRLPLCSDLERERARRRLRDLPAAIAATYPCSAHPHPPTPACWFARPRSSSSVWQWSWEDGSPDRSWPNAVVMRMVAVVVAVLRFSEVRSTGGALGRASSTATLLALTSDLWVRRRSRRANWASTHLPAGTHVAVDRDNGALLNHRNVEPVSPLNGSRYPGTSVLRQGAHTVRSGTHPQGRHSLCRHRHAPYGGAAALRRLHRAGRKLATRTRSTPEDLTKFDSTPGVYRGRRQRCHPGVRRVARRMGKNPLALSGSASTLPATWTDVAVFVLACIVAVVWLFRLRRRARRTPVTEHSVVCWLPGRWQPASSGRLRSGSCICRLDPFPWWYCLCFVLGLRPAAWRATVAQNARRLVLVPSRPTEAKEQVPTASTGSTVSGSGGMAIAGPADPTTRQVQQISCDAGLAGVRRRGALCCRGCRCDGRRPPRIGCLRPSCQSMSARWQGRSRASISIGSSGLRRGSRSSHAIASSGRPRSRPVALLRPCPFPRRAPTRMEPGARGRREAHPIRLQLTCPCLRSVDFPGCCLRPLCVIAAPSDAPRRDSDYGDKE